MCHGLIHLSSLVVLEVKLFVEISLSSRMWWPSSSSSMLYSTTSPLLISSYSSSSFLLFFSCARWPRCDYNFKNIELHLKVVTKIINGID